MSGSNAKLRWDSSASGMEYKNDRACSRGWEIEAGVGRGGGEGGRAGDDGGGEVVVGGDDADDDADDDDDDDDDGGVESGGIGGVDGVGGVGGGGDKGSKGLFLDKVGGFQEWLWRAFQM